MKRLTAHWITAGMFRGDEAKALRDKFDDDWEADQQRKKAQRLDSEELNKPRLQDRSRRGSLIADQ